MKIGTMKKDKQSNRLIPVRSIVVIFAILIMISSISPAIAAKPLYLVEFDRPGYQVNENDGFVTLNLTLNRTMEYNVFWVNYNTHNGTANNVTNFHSPVNSSYPDPAVVTFSYYPGYPNLFEHIKVPIIDDGVYSPIDKFFFMNLTGICPDHHGIFGSNSNVIITIHESSPRPTVQFVADGYTVNEDDGTVSAFVTLSGPTSEDVVVNYETRPGTALAGVNYTTASSSVTFPAGSTTPLEIPVTILDDEIYGGDTFFFVNLTSVSSGNADVGSPDATKVTVVDDEAQFTIDLYRGWNFISSPLVVEPFMVSHLNQMNPLITRVQKYNNNTLIYDPWMLGAPSEYDFMFYTDLGYMVYAERNTTLTFTGHNPVDRSTLLKNAWNSAGWSTFETSDAKSLCALLSGNQRINTFDAIHQVYKPYMEGAPDEYNFDMGPGSGYLIYTDAEVALDFGGI